RASGYFESATARIYSLYQRRLRECNAMDFDDLIFNAVTLLRTNSEIGAKYRCRFKYIMVDEYQDTNHVQYLLLKALAGEHHNLCVVGDEDQSIYGWRGADIRNILEFEADFPGARIIKLEQNYRSTQVILDAASAVIENNESRKGKKLWTSVSGGEKLTLLMVDSAEEEAIQIIDEIERRGAQTGLKEIVVLYRTNAQSRPFEEHLRRRNIPYQLVGGVSFYQRKEIKDLVAYLKLVINVRDDISFERIINYPKRGIGRKTVADITDIARREGVSEYEVVAKADEHPELSGRQKRLQPFVELIERYRTESETKAPDLLVQDLVDELRLIDELRSEDEIIGQTRVENVEAFIEGVTEYTRANPEGALAQYLAEISLFTDVDAYREFDDKVTLMTAHAAKGLEFDVVFIVGLEDGLFPLERSLLEPLELEEERRLFYVGATRARKKLYLSSATTRYRFGEVQSIPSRFIGEIPEILVERVDLRKPRPAASSAAGQVPSFSRRSGTAADGAGQGVHYVFDQADGLHSGRIVQHPTFGRGKIVRTEGYGESLVLDIMFAGIGLKKIAVRYARLKVIG
ncbi:MAG: 3'-5' exonuclease, partial [Candidatus Zixiibacteriota bacterium]